MNVFVKSKTEAKEAISLLEQLGYKRPSWAGSVDSYLGKINFVIISHGEIILCDKTSKEAMSIGQLRDLVVLKRNDVADATRKCIYDNIPEYFMASDGVLYFYENTGWVRTKNTKLWCDTHLKPIIKEPIMKEFLTKTCSGKYKLTLGDGDIEIPEGCNIITCENRNGNIVYFHWKSLGSDEFFLKDEKIWSNNFDETLSDFIEKNKGDVAIIWIRHIPEELPFVDDEPKTKIGELYVDLKVNVDVDVSSSPFDTQIGGSHYKNLAIQPMEYALKNKLDYAQSNVVKYVTRHASKGGKEDLLKAIHNIELMIAHYYS